MIGGKVVEKALLNLGASVNLLPYSVYKQLGLGELKPTSITLSLADRSVKIPRGIIEDVLVQVDNFYYPVDFVVLDTNPIVKEANYVPIILGRPFLATSNAIINCRNGLMQLTFGNMTLELNIFYMSKKLITPEEEEGSFIIVFTDHSALKYLLTKQDAKVRLIKWILLLQEFDLQIRDKKGVENVVADHLSRLVIAQNSHVLPINDDFTEESLMLLAKTPWYAHIANYLVTSEVPSEWKAQDRKHFFAKIHAYYWEEPFLFKYYADQIIRKCVPEEEQQGILSHYHESACGGHFASQKTAMKVLQSGFSWPSLFKDAHIMCRSYDRCQRLGKLTRRNQMPMNPILIVDLFDVWGIDFMGPFPMSFGNSYILVGVDYVSKWVEAIPCKHNDHRVVLKFLKENILSRFRVPKAIISDGGTHFCNRPFETLLAKYGVKHKVAT
ncbi:hypothetical protein VitviT2T_006950 [Vitis vinifera]|uniref:Integrase catalytic domain-containing protein n=1 Tax=Vitis vinifera TaxID=29760 RepID=A0ABY9BXR5_VITVI|nr:hypothetical protein VitviT2T_006950 [Vitis vinifera]